MRAPVVILLLVAWSGPCLGAEELLSIPTRNGVTLSYLLDQDKSATPRVVVISFVGGLGAIGLERRAQKGPVKFGPTANFLVRIRDQVTDADVADVADVIVAWLSGPRGADDAGNPELDARPRLRAGDPMTMLLTRVSTRWRTRPVLQ